MLEYISDSKQWRGESIDGVKHPLSIETEWSHEKLSEIGLKVCTTIYPSHIHEERDRRLSLGFNFDFNDERGIHEIGTSREDVDGWREVSDYANALIHSGFDKSIIYIVTNTGSVGVTAREWQLITLTSASVRQGIWSSSFDILSLDPLPSDYAADYRWSKEPEIDFSQTAKEPQQHQRWRGTDTVEKLKELPDLRVSDGAYAIDGRKNGESTSNGSGVLVCYDGSEWTAVDTGATVAA